MFGEKRMKAVCLCFWSLPLGKIGCLLGTSCVLFMDGYGGKDEWVASGEGNLGPGSYSRPSQLCPCQIMVLSQNCYAIKA